MGLSVVQNKVTTPFVTHIIAHLKKVAGYQAKANAGFEENLATFGCEGYALVCNTKGVITGRIVVHHYPETALPIGNKLLGTKHTKMNDDIINALADFSQQAIAPAIAELEKSDIEIDFSPTYFVSDTKKLGGILEDAKQMLTIPIEIENLGRFYFNFLINSQIQK
ncbi:MAG: hypothetical protein OEW58_03415 [Gammaproteobacteria bacterium]|nr:hypothetical protein [Gammaproteobacteria bacterium]